MEIYLHSVEPDAPFVSAHRDLIEATLAAAPSVRLVDSPEKAECVLVLPSFGGKFPHYSDLLRHDPIIAGAFDRVLVYEGCDGPSGHLPGLYVNMPTARLDDRLMRAFPYLLSPSFPSGPAEGPPRLLYSFRGAPSHPVRLRLAALPRDRRGQVTILDRWLNYSPEEKQHYRQEVLDSAFVLCPRGHGPASVRLQETLEAGRVPVIISDDWTAPQGPAWENFSVRVPEAEIATIPGRLRDLEGSGAEMGMLARQAWEQWFAPGPAIGGWMINTLADVQRARGPAYTFAEASTRWRSAAFKRDAGHLLRQRVRRRLSR